MATLYLDRRGIRLKLDSGALCLMDDEGLVQRLPLGLVERIVVSADVELSSRLLAALGREQVGLLLLDGRQGGHAVLSGGARGDARRRLGQARLALSEESRGEWARRLVRGKILAQARLLRLWAEQRAAARFRLLGQAGKLEPAVRAAAAGASGVEGSIRGIEGAASAAYFEGMREVLAPGLGFEGRNRRPAAGSGKRSAVADLHAVLCGGGGGRAGGGAGRGHRLPAREWAGAGRAGVRPDGTGASGG